MMMKTSTVLLQTTSTSVDDGEDEDADEDADDDEDTHCVVADHLHLRLASNLGHIGTHLKQDSDGRRDKNDFFFSSTKR